MKSKITRESKGIVSWPEEERPRERLLSRVLIAQGAVDSVRPPIRNIISRALQVNASSLIAAHNHPSGLTEPSESDIILTRDLISAATTRDYQTTRKR